MKTLDPTSGKIDRDGKMPAASCKAAGPIPQQPKAAFTVGKSGATAVADYTTSAEFGAKVSNVQVKTPEAADVE